MYKKISRRRREQMLSRIKEEFSHYRKVKIQVEDDRTGLSTETLQSAFADHLLYSQGKYESLADLHDYYMALAYSINHNKLTLFDFEECGYGWCAFDLAKFL